jgi:anti-sigma factor ChrR (cupin superfamily)
LWQQLLLKKTPLFQVANKRTAKGTLERAGFRSVKNHIRQSSDRRTLASVAASSRALAAAAINFVTSSLYPSSLIPRMKDRLQLLEVEGLTKEHSEGAKAKLSRPAQAARYPINNEDFMVYRWRWSVLRICGLRR